MSEKESVPLELSAEPQRRRTGYAHPIPHYCPIYETNERGIKVWLAKGRARSDPPPLDDAEAMPAWWSRNSPQAVPMKLTLAAQRAAAARTASASGSAPVAPAAQSAQPAAAAPPVPATEPPPPAPDAPLGRVTALLDPSESLTLVDAMPRLQRVLAHALREYESAASDPRADETRIALAAQRLDKTIERHRKLEITLLESAQKRGDLVAVAELRPQLAALFGRIAGALVDHLVTRHGVPRSEAIASVDDYYAGVRALPFGDCAPPLPLPAEQAAA